MSDSMRSDRPTADLQAAVRRLQRVMDDHGEDGFRHRTWNCTSCKDISEAFHALWNAVDASEAALADAPLSEDAGRALRSIATMLGWVNVPPQHIFEAEINALKARASRGGDGQQESRP